MNTITLGGYTDMQGNKKGGVIHTVKPLGTIAGTGAGMTLFIGEQKDKNGKKIIKSHSTPRGVSLSRMDRKIKNTVELALPDKKDKTRPDVLRHVHNDNGVLVAADGFRMHIEYGAGGECEICKRDDLNYPNYNAIIPQSEKISVTMDAVGLKNAFIRAGVFARDGSGVTRVKLNGHAEIVGVSDENGQAKTELEYERVNVKDIDELTFGINWEFARDAINHTAPNGGSVTIKATGKAAPVVFESADKQKIAVVMPIYLG